MEKRNAVSIPVDCGIKLSRYDEGSNVDATYFKSLVGSLCYLTWTRPDILYGVGLVSHYMEKSKFTFLMATKGSLAVSKEQSTMDFSTQGVMTFNSLVMRTVIG